VKTFLLIAAVTVAAGCRNADNENRRNDTSVVSPVSVESTPARKTCGVSGAPILTDNGIGELRVDRRVSDVKAACEVLSDTLELGTEGMQEHVVLVRIAGDVVTGSVDDDEIRRISVSTSKFRTRDSIGVDTPLSRIAALRGARFLAGEDGVYGFSSEHCGLSFRFSIPMRPPKGRDWTVASIDSAHGDAVIDRVLVTRCQR
jgi:hypothetical protein